MYLLDRIFRSLKEKGKTFLYFYFVSGWTARPSFRIAVKDVLILARSASPLKTHALFLYENSWQLHHVMFIVSFSAFIFEIPARLKCFQKENQIKSLLNDGTDSPLFGRPAAVR